ncbi:MAG: tetratricopeptide repeat protein [Planctomycetes bacterium]|nr:tetratricopeptide repeat protein [Planctomycetota bacterium]
MDNNNTLDEKLKSLEALLVSKEKGPDEALKSLGESDSPEILRRKLGILNESDRLDEAVDLLKGIPLHERWCDWAICVYVKSGDIPKAKELLEWAKQQDDEVFKNRCRLYFAETYYLQVRENREINSTIFPDSLSDEEKAILNDCRSVLNPILIKIRAEQRISNEIESLAVQMAMEMLYLLNANKQEIESLCKLLETRKPIPIKLGWTALAIMCELSKDVPTRYREEHPNDFDANILASLIESVILKEHLTAFDNIKKAESLIVNDPQKEEFCKALYQIAQCLDNKVLIEAAQFTSKLLGDEHRFSSFFQAEILLNKKDYKAADECLLKIKNEDDPNWLQLYADYLYHTGKQPKALEYMKKACSLLHHSGLRISTARLAFETENYDLAIELLSEELKNDPENPATLSNIAAVYFRKGDFKNAADHYEKLIDIKTEEKSYKINLAACYIQTGIPEKAFDLYEDICKDEQPALDDFLARASLLKIDDPTRAFDSLLPLKDKYWDEPQYLQAILELGYKAGKEEYSNQAMQKLLELQREGKVPKEIIQSKTIEDLKVHIEDWNKKLEIINNNILSGKFPWLMADRWQNHSTYMGWSIRTQPIGWYMEEPMACAAYSIYSTNGFKGIKQSDDLDILGLIDSPPKSSSVVIDISALITLHRLELLEKCFDYFDKIYIPQEYITLLLADKELLAIHQLTRKTSAELIKKKVDSGLISILEDTGTTGDRPLPFVNEHTLPENEDGHYYRLIDIIELAYTVGKLDEAKYNNLKRIASKPSGVDSDHPALKYGESTLVDLPTLESICQIEPDALDAILRTFRVFISNQDKIRNSGTITQITVQQEIKTMNDNLLNICRDGPRLIKESHIAVSELEGNEVSFKSWRLAKGKGLPLLVDDRVLQSLTFNENADIECSAFGTDSLLLQLHDEGLITNNELADAFLNLIAWRYRFIIPPKVVLLELAKRYINHPPGKDLQEVALYMHSCLRDPGLPANQLDTKFKASFAEKLYISWIRLNAEFLVEVWDDLEFSEEIAEKLTNWSINELMPSFPKNLGPNMRVVNNMSNALFNYVLGFSLLIRDHSRASKALQVVAECLGMNETDYFKAVSLVVDKHGI